MAEWHLLIRPPKYCFQSLKLVFFRHFRMAAEPEIKNLRGFLCSWTTLFGGAVPSQGRALRRTRVCRVQAGVRFSREDEGSQLS